MKRSTRAAAIAIALGVGVGAAVRAPAQTAPDPETFLPPVADWSGASEALVAAPDDPWITPAERSGLTTSPDYAETLAWLRRLADAAPEVSLEALGESHEGRTVWLVIAARGGRSPEALRSSGRPTLLVQAGIHPGEIDGKDAGMMLLRDLTVSGRLPDLLDATNLLFIPVLNPDGHERRSPHGRINQRGPRQTGWRTNARNRNLNRDYAKLDTPEARASVSALRRWDPDLFLDVHVTDGMDYQYDVTFGHNGPHAWSPAIAGWLASDLTPALNEALRSAGHVPGPLVLAVDGDDPARGFLEFTASPRYSNGYADAIHVPSLLVENHSLKPFRRRVLGTRVLLEAALRALAAGSKAVRAAVAEDRSRRADPVPLGFSVAEGPAPEVDFLGIRWRHELSSVSGDRRLEWTGEPFRTRLPLHRMTRPVAVAPRPAAYWVPSAWHEVIERLALHGIRFERLDEERELAVDALRLRDVETATSPFEGHTPVTARAEVERRLERFPPGSVRVPTDQPLGTLAALLLEPEATDSFFSWGFFLEVLQRTEYVEGYVVEPLAQEWLERDPAIALEFRRRLAEDPGFARSPRARRDWFYERTPWHDERFRLYPVAREP